MRFLSIICLAGMCGLAVTMLFHFSSENEKKSWLGPYIACIVIALLGGIGFGLTWNAERNRSIEMEKMKVNYAKFQRSK